MNLVFAHGVLIPQRIAGLEYFRDLSKVYRDAFFPNVDVIGGIEDRGKELARQIKERFPTGDIHIVAHSMGGLDARFSLVRDDDLRPRVRSLSTIATPHQGSLIADFLAGKLGFWSWIPGLLIRGVIKAIPSLRENALDDLTTASCDAFNIKFPDVDTVRYYPYAAGGAISTFLTPTHNFIARRGKNAAEQNNDGVVTEASATRPPGLKERPWETDHFGVIGYDLSNIPDLKTSFDHVGAFKRVVERATTQP